MSRREFAFELVELADQLGVGGAADPVDSILRHCRTRIDRWVSQAGSSPCCIANIAASARLETPIFS